MKSSTSSRRTFIQAASAAVAAPFILPSRSWAADAAPNSRVRMGFIGIGKQNTGLMGNFIKDPTVEVVAVCDVDSTRRNAAKETVENHYAKEQGAQVKCDAYNDFREITTRKDIDAVCIATPDHWHAIIALSAVRNGKDVYCEKPLTHNIHEAVTLVAETRGNNRILQTGSMQRSSKEFRIACELVRNGVIGEVKTITTSFGDPARPNAFPEQPMEPGLDWDRWCGPGPVVPYNENLSPRGVCKTFPNWRQTREFGGGMITDWGAHHIDIAQWGLGMDENGPVEVRPPADHENAKRGAQLVYANGVVLTHGDGSPGCSFYGTEGEVHVGRGKFKLILKGEVKHAFMSKEESKGTSLEREYTLAEREYLANAKVKLYESKNQLQDFLACVRSRQKPICEVGTGASSAIACHLMNFGYWHGANVKWDPIAHKFLSGGKDEWLTRQYRGEWKV